jgi:GNAT superfamily N-acetyltransferase
MPDVVIRAANHDEFGAVATLRWEWLLERGRTPIVDRDAFVESFRAWAVGAAPGHRCLVADRSGRVIGMAWLAILQRVPTPNLPDRRSGDLQAVYVVPDQRGAGVGGRLASAILALARDAGLERVTVHSSRRAVPVYARHGFAAVTELLQADLRDSP